jgi:hypothetical protein
MMRARRGSALILVLMMTLAVAGLSIAAIFMASSAGLLSVYYDRERDFRYAADAALEVVRSRLARDTALVVPDTGMRVVLTGYQVFDADGVAVPRVWVNVYAATTGDTLGTGRPFITLIAQAYDDGGTRHVRRMDLRRESFSRYGLFVDSFPGGLAHGPGTVPGRVHTNGTWRSSAAGNTYLDSVTAVAAITGAATYRTDTLTGVPRVRFPRDSTFPELATLATAANLAFAPVSGAGRGSRIEFVAFDADGDGTISEGEGFARIFDLAIVSGVDTSRLKAAPPPANGWNAADGAWETYYRWDDPVVQRQCGAFYRRGGRWHFFPVATHRATWARAVIQQTGGSDFPAVSSSTMNVMNDYSFDAVRRIVNDQPTARCFPAGSPYLLTTERMTNSAGVITGGAADTVPFGVVVPPGGWPASAPAGYGGTDTTFTVRSRTCTFSTTGTSGRCDSGTITDLGTWRAFAGTALSGVPSTIRQAEELPYLWPFGAAHNAASRGVISVASGPIFVSGTVRGQVTLRVAGAAKVVDALRYTSDANDPSRPPCDDEFGLVASGDVLVAEGFDTRVRRFGKENVPASANLDSTFTSLASGQRRFILDGSFISTGGTVGVEGFGTMMGNTAEQLPCAEDGGASTNSNGGCLALTGSAAMRIYSPLYSSATTYSGFRYHGIADRCQESTRRPPFFPLTNRVTLVRTLEVDPILARTPARIRAILMRLKGKAL